MSEKAPVPTPCELLFVESNLLKNARESWQRLLDVGLANGDSEIGKAMSALFEGARAVPAIVTLAKETLNGSEHNDWFLSLEEGRQKVLREDKWTLASAMFKAGFELSSKINAVPLLAAMGDVAEEKYRLGWDLATEAAKPLAEFHFVDYPSMGGTNYWTVRNTAATVKFKTREEVEAWALHNGMRIK